ncbi:MAG: TRAP transporter small permease subunit [Gammaproteobacteria bacterium]|nr:TRAP transporter small permease subunit [Gammaproteobacteria bacterium]
MDLLLKIAGAIDTLNKGFGKLANWAVLLACLISAGNALVRYALHMSSNAWLEVQWYLFAGIVMLGASYTLKLNEHVRVDIFYNRLPPRVCAWIDLIGCLLFLLPATVLLAWFAWPFFVNSYRLDEISANPGGLTLWWVKLLLPLGFTLLSLQGVAEVIKRIGFLTGRYSMDTHYERPLQ